MRKKQWLLALALPLLLGGCYTAAGVEATYSVGYDPPPVAYTYVDYRPGYVWVDGNYYWYRNNWAWRPGYYVRERPGYIYTQGVWVGRTWRPGYWAPYRSHYRSSAGTVTRNVWPQSGRQNIRTPAPVRSRGVHVRDHRR